MKSLIATRSRRLVLALIVMLLLGAALIGGALSHGGSQTLNIGDEMKRWIGLPVLAGIAVFALATAWSTSSASAAEPNTTQVPAAPAAPAKPFLAQVVGLEWLNPLQRRDYPTEWQLLWTMGLVKPNKNDDMVRKDPKSFTSLQPVAIVADGNNGRESFDGFYEKYVTQLLVLFADKYVMNGRYFYTVQPSNRRHWRELAGIRIELAIPPRLAPQEATSYLTKEMITAFSIGNKEFTDLWSKDLPPHIQTQIGGANAGFMSLNAALDYLQSHPQESVWVMNWDAPSFPPKDQQMNENLTLLFLAGPELKTEREPLAWIGRAATGNVSDYEAKAGTTRAVQAWKATIVQAAQNASVDPSSIKFVVHDAGKGGEAASARLGSLSQTLTETLPEFDYGKQVFNTPALLGEMGAGTALTDVALAIGRINHFGGNALVAGTTDANHPTAIVILPPSKLTPIDPDKDWFRARGEDNAYLPWWGRRSDVNYGMQGYSY
ncbi:MULTISPECIES: virulence factor [Paraburkholderia]|uniref:virulence factor n=1 Tax=Paraburkholderia TaxID=1822464 RepID=UPI002258009F|nr:MULTISPECIES: virulence factor [Paraburkholderia]MCX4160300.1 virulence factor [Paraburkholderia megapolitana]MDN7155799.1 virulence factor [Paraburkholderia sp. CHISQ3]MDQ6492843.1 virulence factor [Paraburkholderia megapolitana]